MKEEVAFKACYILEEVFMGLVSYMTRLDVVCVALHMVLYFAYYFSLSISGSANISGKTLAKSKSG